MSNWISVKDRLPAENVYVLLCFEDGPDYAMEVGMYRDNQFHAGDFIIDPTHWQPLPDPPKREPFYVERKTRRVQLVLQPSLYERVKARAKVRGLSV